MWIQVVAIALPRIQRHFEGEFGFCDRLGCVPGEAARIDRLARGSPHIGAHGIGAWRMSLSALIHLEAFMLTRE